MIYPVTPDLHHAKICFTSRGKMVKNIILLRIDRIWLGDVKSLARLL